jgi:uncharacterized membrane protein YphA (DoxX/SURF4 family)
MFPSGWAGVALLLLRFAAVGLTADASCRPAQHISFYCLSAAQLVIAFFLFTGFLTPLAATAYCVLDVFAAIERKAADPFEIILAIVVATVLALLGPGAYSLDAIRFGRRVVKPPSTLDK